MNKDLDDRLIPNGEYRDAQNISVGKSEADDIGALENILGNTLVPGTDLNNANLVIIGYFTDSNSNTIYLFLTDNTNHYIYKYSNNSYVPLVEGSFLNFNKENLITGVNLVENLLFFTDNRNQPRKINVTKPLGYYTKENQISVAKYNPYEAITLLKSLEVTGATSSGVTITLAQANANIKKGMLLIVKQANGTIKIPATEYLYVSNISGVTVTLNVAPSQTIANTDVITFLATTMTGKDITYDFNSGVDWPGDPDFLEDLFVRFSYRFKFDDNEYSLMAPFTQPAFIPQQKGYFFSGDEDAAYRSTILDFMQNGVQNVELVIPLPDIQGNLGNQIADTYKIIAIDILYKESDARAVKVLDTVLTSDFLPTTSGINTYTYDYQSRKPYKTLPERQTIRVYDKVPVKALAQEVSGNRVMYANFQSQHTPPNTINYNVGANAKSADVFTTWAEYPNHTLKQNRNYQVGFILADKFGRQSSVILSSVDAGTTENGTFFGGSTFYHPYKSTTQDLKAWFGDALKVVVNSPITSTVDAETGTPGLYAVPEGNGFNVLSVTQLNTALTIPVLNIAGFEYEFTLVNTTATTNAVQYNVGDDITVTITAGNADIKVGDSLINNTTKAVYGIITELIGSSPYTQFKANITATLPQSTLLLFCDITDISSVGEYLRGEYEDFVEVVEVDLTSLPICEMYTKTKINEFLYEKTLNNPDTKYAYTLPNPLGWYSYKIVVKQQEQDYYNCYFPGFLNSYPSTSGVTDPPIFPTATELNKTGHVVLLNDNINKVPRDLSEVGPEQKQFRSSVRLYGRVNNTTTDNVQFFPVNISGTQILPLSMTADTIADANDLKMNVEKISTTNVPFYQLETNPLIARLATLNSGTTNIGVAAASYPSAYYLSVAETEPVDSLLQLFYETSTAGLIADLNADVNTGFDGVAGLSALSYAQNEGMAASTNVTGVFYAQNNQGSNFANTDIAAGFPIRTITDASGANRTSDFTLITSGTGYRLQTAVNTFVYSNAGYENNGDSKEVYTIELQWKTTSGDESTTTSTGSLSNLAPEFTAGASLPDITVSASATAVGTRNGNNGSATNNTSELRYSITSGNSNNYFAYDSATGVITKSNSTPIGVYNLTLKIEDAVVGGVAKTGSLSVSKTQKITVGAVAVNSGVISSCLASGVVSAGIPATQQSVIPNTTNSSNVINAVWYLSDNTLSGSDFPIVPDTNTGNSNFTNKLGSALTQGTVVFQCNMQQSFTNNSGGMSFTLSYLDWVVYHRTDANDVNGWQQRNDVNNSNILADVELLNSSFNSTKYASTAFAFDQPGEYAIIAKDAYVHQAQIYADSLCLWVNSNDLYYSTCVVEDGSNVTSGASPKYYSYHLGSNGASYNICGNTGNTLRYAPMPYAQYVDLFYTDTSLANPWTSATIGSTFPAFYSFTTQFGQPFDQIRINAKFNTSGIKISGDASTCSDTYARACVSSSSFCSRPVPGAVNWV